MTEVSSLNQAMKRASAKRGLCGKGLGIFDRELTSQDFAKAVFGHEIWKMGVSSFTYEERSRRLSRSDTVR